MIKITINKNKNIIDSVVISGHALYGNFGKDIVCAGVSSIVTTSVNAILSLEKDSITFEQKEGFVKIEIIKNTDIVDKLVNNMINMFVDIEKQYPKNIKIFK